MNDLDFFIRQTAKQVMIPEPVVDKIIRDQWKYANRASSQLLEIEIKDMGIFYPSPKKIASAIGRLINRHQRLLAVIELNHREADYKSLMEAEDHINMLTKTKHYDKSKGYLAKQGIDIGRYKEQYFSKGGS